MTSEMQNVMDTSKALAVQAHGAARAHDAFVMSVMNQQHIENTHTLDMITCKNVLKVQGRKLYFRS